MSDTSTITPRQNEILFFIRDKIVERGYPPSIREIGEAFDIVSPNGVMCHLKALEKKGFIERNKGVLNHKSAARAITIPGMRTTPAVFPMLGLVAAGPAIEAVPQNEQVDLGELFAGKDHFALRIKGQSMIEDHIDEGDIVIIRRQETAENGDRVVAMIDGSTTLKKFYRRKNQIVLEPSNSMLPPIVIDPEEQNFSLVGILVGVVRKC
ncbi:transcriptional repressor LexA [Zavarzinella formosa]|uniref:transcriptional repressor LexA n=1 Tax=Zavarzinella formosa TaxID=360055 RepID=UPI0002D2589E|nr:transcriptional repressor LexA [Zavarzinella formosa]